MLARVTAHVDLATATRFERSQAARLEAFARVVGERLPSIGAAGLPIAGGFALFLAPHISTSRAMGLGMSGPVQAADVEALERFYRDRETEARILVCPFADESLLEHLGDRGFRLAELDTVLYRRIGRADRTPAPHPGIEVHRVSPDGAAAWVRTSLTGFAPPGEEPSLGLSPIYEAGFHEPSFIYLAATASGELAGTAALQIHDATAHFFADSTVPEHRGRGVQTTLIAARLALARDAGCDLAFAETAPGSSSQRSYERAGFVVAYSVARMVKRFDQTSPLQSP